VDSDEVDSVKVEENELLLVYLTINQREEEKKGTRPGGREPERGGQGGLGEGRRERHTPPQITLLHQSRTFHHKHQLSLNRVQSLVDLSSAAVSMSLLASRIALGDDTIEDDDVNEE
jgi:hypothetical protein